MPDKTPQLEDGFTMLANELMERVLGFGFSHREQSVIFTIFRKTYGYGKKEDDMSSSQIGAMCNIARQHVTSTLNTLALCNVITKRPGRFGSIIGIQKDHRKWVNSKHFKNASASPKSGQVDSPDLGQGSPDLGLANDDENAPSDSPDSGQCPDLGHVPICISASPKSGQVDSPKSGHTKENLPKENQQKKGAREEILFSEWIQRCKDRDETPIPEDDPVFKYADELGLPLDFIRYCWVEFKRKYAQSRKKYRSWNQHFSNAVRENWYVIWYERDGTWLLTTRGKQIETECRNRNNAQ